MIHRIDWDDFWCWGVAIRSADEAARLSQWAQANGYITDLAYSIKAPRQCHWYESDDDEDPTLQWGFERLGIYCDIPLEMFLEDPERDWGKIGFPITNDSLRDAIDAAISRSCTQVYFREKLVVI